MPAKCTCDTCRATRLLTGIRKPLRAGDSTDAVYKAVGAVQGELSRLRDHRPTDAAAIHAEVAGVLALLATRLATWKPQQGDLMTVFETALAPKEKGKA